LIDPKYRRKDILKILSDAINPISGEKLASKFNVTRQVIVQDIAILRAEHNDIISTNRGYYLNEDKTKRIFKVKHKDQDIRKELYSIVDLGGTVKDVIVNHKVYGDIKKDLNVSSRRDVDIFIDKMKSENSKPLDILTGGIHFHTVIADNIEIIDEIELRLQELGFLVE